MKKLTIYFIIVILATQAYSQTQKRQATKIITLGYVYNYGTGEVETGGRMLSLDKDYIQPNDKIFFEIVSGTVDKISIVAVNKYDVWTNVLNSGKIGIKYSYNGYFKNFAENKDFYGYKISVNGSHNQYKKQACVIKVCMIRKTDLVEEDFRTEFEEISPGSKKGYKGIVCDGVSKLRIDFYYPGNTSIDIKIPDFGSFTDNDNREITKGEKTISLDEAGHAYLIFTPPSQIDQDLWNELSAQSAPLTGLEKYAGEISGNSVDLKLPISFSGFDKKDTNDTVIIEIYRPPVFFVHGFLGSERTWGGMSIDIGSSGFITISKSYYAGDGSIADQSELLGKNIRDQLTTMNLAGVKAAKVDLVCHSMGGLIARYYVQSELYEKNVRKLIFVGTPNHGVSSIGFYIGKLGSAWKEKHQKAIYELRENSEFLQTLNSGEYMGDHLVKDIEYGNIYTNPSDYVVSASSARLNMVPSLLIYGVSHSTDISSKAITNHPSVRNQIITWLGVEIRRAPNVHLKAELSRASKGEVYRTYFPTGSYTLKEEKINSFPCEFKLYHSLKTGDGNAILHLKAGNKIWGSIFLDENSEIHIGSCSPDWMEIRLLNGKAQFKGVKSNGGHFIVAVHDKNSPYFNNGNFEFNPKAIVKGLDTEFAIDYETDEIKVYGIEGKMEISTDFSVNGIPVTITNKESVIIENNQINETKYKDPKWTTNLSKEVDEKTGEEISEKEYDKNSGSANEGGSIILILIGLGVVAFVVAIVILIVVLLIKAIRKNKSS